MCHHIPHRETKKFKNNPSTDTLRPNTICMSREYYIKSGSLGLSLVRILSLNKNHSVAVCLKARPAHLKLSDFKKPLIVSRDTSDLYFITDDHQEYNRESEVRFQTDIDKLASFPNVDHGLIFDAVIEKRATEKGKVSGNPTAKKADESVSGPNLESNTNVLKPNKLKLQLQPQVGSDILDISQKMRPRNNKKLKGKVKVKLGNIEEESEPAMV